MSPIDRCRLTISKLLIWSFFILIVDQLLVNQGFNLGLMTKPVYVYCVISVGLLISGLLVDTGAYKSLANEKAFFLPFIAIVVLGAAMYRGEAPGPDFGAAISRPEYIPSRIGYAVWPALNLLSAAGLYLLAQKDNLRRTIVAAVFAALILQVLTMEADMFWPALFGDPNGRAGGLARNANVAAILVVTLAALTLRSSFAAYAVVVALAGVLLAQSKAGGFAAVGILAGLLWGPRDTIDRRSAGFAALIFVGVGLTVYFSPVLNPPEEIIAAAKPAETDSAPTAPSPAPIVVPELLKEPPPIAVLDQPVPLSKRLEDRTSLEGSAELRRAALLFFWEVFRQKPTGYGTGFTNQFVTGPHNAFLKLAVDNGLLAPILLLLMFCGVLWRAYQTRSPQLFAILYVASIAAVLYHTLVVDPIILPSLGLGLSLLRSPSLFVRASSTR